jgi:hypothetical protein
VPGINPFLLRYIDKYVASVNVHSPEIIRDVFANATAMIEKNRILTEYSDETLYSHQKDLFDIFKKGGARGAPIPKCVLYMAPTGTGKTMSPIGLSQGYRILFVCAARHVGLALAKSAISVGKRVAFAFGCETASDIRLHYFAAADYTVNRKTGGIFRVDNSNGVRVEIMICDMASYLIAMYYMKSFHSAENIITYWDEPTIGMDRNAGEDEKIDELHKLIHRVWSQNQIPNIVLSCATLPKPDEIGGALHDFRAKFMADDGTEPEIHVIESHDCKKTISLLGKDGKVILPHLQFASYSALIMDCVDHCDANRSVLRYFDVSEIIRFSSHVQPYLREDMRIERWFKSVETITMHSIKLYYLAVLRELPADQWSNIHQFMKDTLKPKFVPHDVGNDIRKIKSVSGVSPHPVSTALTRQNSIAISSPPSQTLPPSAGILLTTVDAHTLTDGPTIYLAEDIEKIGRFYIQQSKIPDTVFASIQQKIDRNNLILKQINRIEKEVEAKMGTPSTDEKSSKKAEKEPASKEVKRMLDQIQEMRASMHNIHLSAMYIPNTKQHQEVWLPKTTPIVKNAFVPNVDEADVREIMALNVDNQHKLLLILGIGVFSRARI